MFHYPKAALRVGPRALVTYLFMIKKWAKHPERYPLELKSSKIRVLFKKISDALQVDLHCFGLENIPTDENFYIVSNHLSGFDTFPFLSLVNGPLTLVGKMEIMKMPFVGPTMKAIEVEPIQREDLRQTFKAMQAVEEDLKKGETSWLIFPEGTRIRDQMLPVAPFHHGTFRPAMRAGVAILPAALFGTFRVLRTRPQFKRYPVLITFLKPIRVAQYEHLTTAEMAALTRELIQKEITYHLRPLDHEIMKKNREKKYRFDLIITH
ncbi:MAG: 1-acyl-sn-glycerol-3-phosphate acyltransferase [Erysipelotrichia bacterium]|nr:1-acyl-sn-glycerol-3-phosphate acyltransferase [Erysipelotrichia bacterium]